MATDSVFDLEFYQGDKDAIYNEIGDADTAIGRQIMVNKEFRTLFAEIITKEAKTDSVYKGSVIIGSVGGEEEHEISSLKILKDPYTVDLISAKIKKSSKCNKKTQCIYRSVEDYLNANPPEKDKMSIYYVADAHGEEEEVHWNCVISDDINKRIVLYDPSTQGGYDFAEIKRTTFIQTLEKMTGLPAYRIVFDVVQQIFCDPKYPGADIFCQSWVMLFSSMYILDLLDGFAKIDYIKLQSLPLKMWLICIFNKYDKILQIKSYQVEVEAFYKYAIIDKKKNFEIVLLPEVINCGKKQPVAFSVIKNFFNPNLKNSYKFVPITNQK